MTGMEMMLRTLGIDPEKIKQSVEVLQNGVISLDQSLKRIATQNDALLNGIASIHERLNGIECELQMREVNGQLPMVTMEKENG